MNSLQSLARIIGGLCLLWTGGIANIHAELASDSISIEQERSRIQQARQQLEAKYDAQLQNCRGKFASTDCVKAAKSERRRDSDRLKHEEIAVNDLERKHRAIQQQRRIEKRILDQESTGKFNAAPDARIRPRTAALAPAGIEVPTTLAPVEKKGVVSTTESSHRAQRYEQKQREAAEHRQKVEASRSSKQQAQGLPTPQ